ncbi:MAG: nucleoside-diphosphate sugar epimerase [Lysobacterales bacterium]|jgi:mitochondrial fission protein ELM1|nr:MAG: nucleoside-diphosphate sugar epimerase [Xanthomonadales bacterium]
MNIWALSDAAAGHRRQALALAESLGERLGGVVEAFPLKARWPVRWLAPCFGTLADLMSERGPLAPPWPDLVVGCGRIAALATRRLREEGVRAVQILNPGIDPRHWDLLIVPRHDRLAGENVLTTIGSLHRLSPERLAALAAANPALRDLPSPRTLLLLGGPTRHLRWGRRDLRQLIAILRHWLERDGGSLLIALSRRSPRWAARALRAAFPEALFTPERGQNLYEAFLGCAERIVVSADSVNMLSEACAAGVPVRYFAPRPPSPKLGDFLLALVEGDHARPLRIELGRGGAKALSELPTLCERLCERLGL